MTFKEEQELIEQRKRELEAAMPQAKAAFEDTVLSRSRLRRLAVQDPETLVKEVDQLRDDLHVAEVTLRDIATLPNLPIEHAKAIAASALRAIKHGEPGER